MVISPPITTKLVVANTSQATLEFGSSLAGDQGIMFGFACKETEGYMPLAISIAHHLVRYATEKKNSGEFKYARPDMKAQVTIDYTEKDPKIVQVR